MGKKGTVHFFKLYQLVKGNIVFLLMNLPSVIFLRTLHFKEIFYMSGCIKGQIPPSWL